MLQCPQGITYTQVCGRTIGYQYHSPNAFAPSIIGNASLERLYIDGVSLTHGPPGLRTHVWSFANAVYETLNECPCNLLNSSH